VFFVVDKPRLERMISIVREDKTRKKQMEDVPFLRIEAVENQLAVSGDKVSATFPATVYEQGVLFLRTTYFRRLVRTFKGEKFLAFQVTKDGLLVGNVLMPFEGSDMVYYPNPADAPKNWPPKVEVPEAEQLPEKKEPTLFDSEDENKDESLI
jgi:hypothetical protein